MRKNLLISILIVSFSLSGVNAGWAVDMLEVPPVIVHTYDLQALNQHMLQRDRQTRDEEIAIKALIEQNNELIQTTLSRQQREGLQKINQTMLNYRDALLNRDRARIMANSQQPSRYADLVALTQDVEVMKGIHHDLEGRSNIIEEKYQILNDLKNEMMALNEKLKSPASRQEALDQKDEVIAGFKKIAQQEQDKIQVLVARLDEMDKKIAHFDEILAQKDRQIAQLGTQLAQKQQQVDLLKEELENKITANEPGQSDEPKDKDETIRWLKEVLAVTRAKAEYFRLSSQQEQIPMPQLQQEVQKIKEDFALRLGDFDQYERAIISLKDKVGQLGTQLTQKQKQVDLLKAAVVPSDDRLELAGQLIDLQQQETALLMEKSRLALKKYALFNGRLAGFEDRLKALLADHRTKFMDWQNRVEELKNALDQKQQETSTLKGQLEAKIAQQKNQEHLEGQIRELKTQLQDSKDQMAKLKAQIQDSLASQAGVDSLKEELAAQQGKVVLLQEELKNKIAESDKMTLMMAEYQKKLEAKDNAYNEQLQESLAFKQYKIDMEKQISDLNVELRGKDLSLSMLQQKMDDKIKEIKTIETQLALDRQRLAGMPNSDEIDFLRSGFQKATAQLKEKEQALAKIKADTGAYAKQLADQNKEFQNLKDQLQDTQEQLAKSREDVKYKNMEIVQLKDRAKTLTGKLAVAEKKLNSKIHGDKVAAVEAQLKVATQRIKDLEAEVNQFEAQSKNDAVSIKLKQALDKINEQGRLINALNQKLETIGVRSDELSGNADVGK